MWSLVGPPFQVRVGSVGALLEGHRRRRAAGVVGVPPAARRRSHRRGVAAVDRLLDARLAVAALEREPERDVALDGRPQAIEQGPERWRRRPARCGRGVGAASAAGVAASARRSSRSARRPRSRRQSRRASSARPCHAAASASRGVAGAVRLPRSASSAWRRSGSRAGRAPPCVDRRARSRRAWRAPTGAARRHGRAAGAHQSRIGGVRDASREDPSTRSPESSQSQLAHSGP